MAVVISTSEYGTIVVRPVSRVIADPSMATLICLCGVVPLFTLISSIGCLSLTNCGDAPCQPFYGVAVVVGFLGGMSTALTIRESEGTGIKIVAISMTCSFLASLILGGVGLWKC